MYKVFSDYEDGVQIHVCAELLRMGMGHGQERTSFRSTIGPEKQRREMK